VLTLGLTLEAAGWLDGQLALTTDLTTALPDTLFSWRNKESQAEPAKKAATVALPVYINSERTDFLFTLDLPAPGSVPKEIWYQRGTALICHAS